MYQLWAAWSQNERAAGRPGVDLPPPSDEWLADVFNILLRDLERDEQNRNT